MNEQALLLIDQCRCLQCNHRWRESSLLFRTSTGYSYTQTDERLKALQNGTIPVVGRRCTKRATGACHQCVQAPKITIWEGHLQFDPDFPPNAGEPTRRKREQDQINKLLEI